MSLVDEFKVPCVLLVKSRVPDGEGGWYTKWADGPEFEAAIVHDTTLQARVAESEGMTSTYKVTTDRNAKLAYHDAFRRVSDGQTFRVTSDGEDVQTPDRASFQFSQVTAERWTPPADGSDG